MPRVTSLTLTGVTLLVGAALISGCGGTSVPSSPPTIMRTAAASPTHSAPVAAPKIQAGSSRLLGIYGSAVPGTPTAQAELEYASQAGFNLLLNYSSVNATPQAVIAYLALAQSLHMKVILSVKDLLGPTDQDPTDAGWHRQYGASTTAEVSGIVKAYAANPAVWGFYTSDEEPTDPSNLSQWLPAIQARQRQIQRLTHKPTLVVLDWSPGSTDYYQQIAQATDQLGIDYYPIPASATYGPVSAITTIGRALRAAAGKNTWFVVQAFAWNRVMHPEGAALGFPADPAPPTARQMVKMAKLAVKAGVRNLLFYSYMDNMNDPGQLRAIKQAVRTIRASTWWKR